MPRKKKAATVAPKPKAAAKKQKPRGPQPGNPEKDAGGFDRNGVFWKK